MAYANNEADEKNALKLFLLAHFPITMATENLTGKNVRQSDGLGINQPWTEPAFIVKKINCLVEK